MTGKSVESQELTVQIDKNGQYFIGSSQLGLQALENKLKAVTGDRSVRIEADKQADFDYVMRAWDLAKQAGIKEIVVLTQKGT